MKSQSVCCQTLTQRPYLWSAGADGRCEETTWPLADLKARPRLCSAVSEHHFSQGSRVNTTVQYAFSPSCCSVLYMFR